MIRHAVDNARWDVMWVGKGKRIIVKEFDEDLVGAIELYMLVKKAKKPMATLRCCNVGFRPPDKYYDKMVAYNKQGVWWCPYCMELRRFEKCLHAFDDFGDAYAIDPEYRCPMCDITHTDWHVIRYNPVAKRLRDRRGARKRSSKGRKRRGKK
jgi:hypothetical protein